MVIQLSVDWLHSLDVLRIAIDQLGWECCPLHHREYLQEPTKNLFRQTRLKLVAELIGIAKVEASEQFGRLEFGKNAKVDPLNIVNLVQKQPQHYKLEGANHLKFIFDMETADARLKSVAKCFDELQIAS